MSVQNQYSSFVNQLPAVQRLLAIAYVISLPLSMTASWVLLTIGLICLLIEIRESGPTAPLELPLAKPIGLFVLAVFISGMFNGGIDEAFRSVISLKALSAYFWLGCVFQRDRSAAKTSVISLLCVTSIAGIWGTIQQIFNIHPFGFRYLQGTGFLGGPMSFAGQMQLFSMIALSLALSAKGPSGKEAGALSAPDMKSVATRQLANPSRYLLIAMASANLMGLIFAGERSAWLGGIAGVSVLAALLSWRTLLKCLAILIIAGGISWYTVPLVHTRVGAIMSGKGDVSVTVRLKIWKIALMDWKRSPLVGIGLLKFPHLYIPEALVPGKSKDLNHAHSNYLQMLTTTGLVGLSAYLWLCLAQIVVCRKRIRESAKAGDAFELNLARGTLAGAVSLMVSGLFEYNFGAAQVRLAQWCILGLMSANGNEPPGKHDSPE